MQGVYIGGMEMNPAPIVLWHQEGAELLGISIEQAWEVVPSKILYKADLEKIIHQLGLGAEARERLEKRLPGPRGRG